MYEWRQARTKGCPFILANGYDKYFIISLCMQKRNILFITARKKYLVNGIFFFSHKLGINELIIQFAVFFLTLLNLYNFFKITHKKLDQNLVVIFPTEKKSSKNI